MNDVMIFSVISLGAIGVAAAVILYFVAQKFRVIEDPKIDEVEEALPAANCGGCGYPGCRGFAEALVKSANENKHIEGLNCPVGGNDVMSKVASILGLEVEASKPMIAVVRCNGSRENSPQKVFYDGPATCAFAHNLYSGEGGCPYGCLGLGDCVASCLFDAIHMDPVTGLPVVNDKCVACGACVKACPRGIIELRFQGPKEKGGPARKNCAVACIGCGLCEKECKFDAITIKDNLAYIDFRKCTLCRKCVPVCPTNAIHELNLPPRKEKPAAEPVSEKSEKAGEEKETGKKEN